ncbi:mitochondrial ribosomal death-associated protein 3-domain-containing protein [Mycena capillaripes]|nr:mitochondrial ribosomal death-associated protein 3-domain-containing protein [Mycena capillaripes]
MTHLLSRAQAGPVRLLRLGARSKKTRSAYYVPLPSSSSSSKGGGGKPAVIQRDAMGRPIVKQREKSLGTFKALPAGGLQHELFESEDDGPGRVGLDVPVMLPRMLVPGVATRFHDMDASSPMRVYGVPKHMLLEFRILGAPISITTSTTLSLIRALEESAQNSKSQSLVLNGRSGTGKSFLLLQAAQYASSSRTWIVLYIPRAQRLVDSSTPFVYSLATRTYLQPRASAQILSRLQRANAHILPQLSTRTAITLPDNAGNFPAGTPLPTLIEAGVTAEAIAPHLLEAVMRELGEQEEYPVLIAIDDFQALAGRTLYRDPRFKMVRPHHLSVPRLLLEYAGGKKKLKRGLVLSALSRSDTQFPVPPQLADALRLPHDFAPTPRGVGLRRSAQLAEYLEGEVEEPIPSSSSVDDPLADPSPSAGAEQWTGYRAYSPPLYEDALFASATAAQPFPSARPEEEVWKGKVLRDEIDEPVVNEVVEEGCGGRRCGR